LPSSLHCSPTATPHPPSPCPPTTLFRSPHLDRLTRLDQVDRLPLGQLLLQSLESKLPQQLDELAPSHLQVPSGSRLRIDYSADRSEEHTSELQSRENRVCRLRLEKINAK